MKSKLYSSCRNFSVVVGFCSNKPTFSRSKKVIAFPRTALAHSLPSSSPWPPRSPSPYTLAPAPTPLSHNPSLPPTHHQLHRLSCCPSNMAGSSLPQDLCTCSSAYLKCFTPRASVSTPLPPSPHDTDSGVPFYYFEAVLCCICRAQHIVRLNIFSLNKDTRCYIFKAPKGNKLQPVPRLLGFHLLPPSLPTL